MKVLKHPNLVSIFIVQQEGRRDRLATLSLAPGVKVYNEEVIIEDSREYRVWDPHRSKLAASILKGMDVSAIGPNARILYLGASTGTTVSHVSDVVGLEGRVFAVEVSSRVMHEFIDGVVRHRPNVFPIFGDARRPTQYGMLVGEADVLYCDIAQPDQTEIAIENAHLLLGRRRCLFLAVKARSIDVTKELSQVYQEEREKLENADFRVLDMKELDPYAKDHVMIIVQKRD